MTPVSDRVLWPDSNVARNTKKFLQLLRRARAKGVAVCMHAQVYLETRRYRRSLLESTGQHFNEKMFDQIFERGHAMHAAFEDLVVSRDTAARWSDLLARRYPTDAEWQHVKRRALHATHNDLSTSGQKNVPMTADWWISLSLEEAPTAFVVTEDHGPEWAHLFDSKRILGYEAALSWLDAMADAPPEG